MSAQRLAETATLGSLLFDSDQFEQVARWLRSGDFADPWHAEVYVAMREHLAAGKRVEPEGVGRQLLERVGPRRADLPRIAGLLHATPVRPRPLGYAAMVLESSLRREVACQGVMLRAAALSAALAQESRPVIAVTAMVEGTLVAGEQRWQLASGDTPTAVASTCPSLRPVLRNTDGALGADRLLAAHPEMDQREVCAHEQRLIAALICHPARVPAVARWLRPDAMVDRSWCSAYSALVDLVERGEPADVVTVAWEIQRASRKLGAGPDTDTLVRAVDAAVADDPGYLGRLVASDLVRRTADSAASALATAATNPGVDIRDLFDTGRLLAGSVRLAAAGLPDSAGDSVPGRHLQPVRSELVSASPAAHAGPVAG